MSMSVMGKMLCSKLKLPFANKGKHKKEEEGSSLMRKANVRQEYTETFRTKSYIEISTKVECHLLRVPSLDDEDSTGAPWPPTTAAAHHTHLSEYLLSPYQKPSTSSTPNTFDFHQLFTNYFDLTLEACRICESLLTSINQARQNHLRIKKAIKITARISDADHRCGGDAELHRVLYKNLACFAAQRNPFSTTTFSDLREAHVVMFRELTSACRKLRRRAKIAKLIKRTLAVLVLMGFGALLFVMAFAIAVHFPAAAPAALAMLPLVVRRMRRRCDEKWAEGAAAKLDVAARGVFIMINELATMSRMVKRLEDEIEHRRYVADVCVRKGKKETLKEVVREFQMHESCFVEQLEELEKQICLCFLDINRSKKLLVREIYG